MTLFATDLRRATRPTDLEGAVARLEAEAREHPGVEHPWLDRVARGGYRDPEGMLRRFAHEYHGYLAWYPHCLELAILRSASPLQQVPWQRRLAREFGHLGEAECEALRGLGINPHTVAGVPRAALFRRFAVAVGVQDDELAQPGAAAARWREQLLAFLREATPAEAVGAVALGSECVDRHVHAPVLAGLLALGTLRRDALVFFETACQPAAEHRQDLRALAGQLAEVAGGLDGLRHGMHTALDLRREFLDRLAVLTMDSV